MFWRPLRQLQPLFLDKIGNSWSLVCILFFISRCQRAYLFNEPGEWRRETERSERSCRVPARETCPNKSGPAPTGHWGSAAQELSMVCVSVLKLLQKFNNYPFVLPYKGSFINITIQVTKINYIKKTNGFLLSLHDFSTVSLWTTKMIPFTPYIPLPWTHRIGSGLTLRIVN